MRRCFLYIAGIILLFLAGCTRLNQDETITDQPFEKISFTNQATEVAAFTVSSDNDLYVLENEGLLTRYSNDGTKKQDYSNTHDFTALCWDNGIIYAYDAVKSQIVSLGTDDGKMKVIADNLVADEVLKLVKADEYLYALVIPDAHGNFEPGLNGYIDYGEILYQININKGTIKDTKEDKIIAIYGTSNDILYYYAYRNDTYALYSYNTKNGKSIKLNDMNDAGYISAFIYEKNYFVFSDLNNTNIRCFNLSDDAEQTLSDNILIISGNDLAFLKGNIIYFGYNGNGEPNAIECKYLDDINAEIEKENADSNIGAKIPDRGEVIVSTSMRNYINPKAVKDISGISTKIVDQSVYDEVLLTEIMSGNPDVDIYITFYGDTVAAGVNEKNIYVPLNNSEVINSYMGKCFDYVSDAMKSQTGDVWMLPISLDGHAIWYVPENTEKFEIDPTEFQYLDSFLNLSKRMPKTGSYVAYVDYAGNLGGELHDQYDMTYNDFNNNTVNFDTRLYKDVFDKMWTGWLNYSPNPRHPLFRDSRDDYNGELEEESAPFDLSKLIYKWSGIGDQLNMSDITLEGWRALPTPRISTDAKYNVVTMTCAFINPYSKNKELAKEYLEAITKVPFEYSINAAFVFKDKSMYADRYDINQPAFDDVYNIFKDGRLRKTIFYLNFSIIDDYQNGRLTLDEAVAAIQREAEMWLNE